MPEEITLESLALVVEGLKSELAEAKKTAENAEALAGRAASDASLALSTAQEAVGAKALRAAEAAAVLEPAKIPEEAFEHDGKEYKFTKAKMRIAGDPKLYTALEVAATAGQADGLFAKVLAIEGQQLLKEQA